MRSLPSTAHHFLCDAVVFLSLTCPSCARLREMSAGKIDYHELKVAMRSLGFDVKKAEALALMDEHDVVGSGYIGYDEFLDIMARRIADRSPEEELRKAFELFDEDGTGRISLRNLRHVVKELGENLSDDELQAMIEVSWGSWTPLVSFAAECHMLCISSTCYRHD